MKWRTNCFKKEDSDSNFYFDTTLNPIFSWCDNVEDSALEQAKNLANLPFVCKNIALMPDAHTGYGMPIGGVIATDGYIIPNAVGNDIGCGMHLIKTNLTEISKESLLKIRSEIRKVIPIGVGKIHKKPQKDIYLSDYTHNRIITQNITNALKSLGTLGAGNHFIEIQKGSDGFIYIMIHCGSRNLGYKVCKYYDNLAKEINAEYFSSVPKNHDLAFLPINSKEGSNYFTDMHWCTLYARNNRDLIGTRIKDIFVKEISNVSFTEDYDVPHNYAAFENHYDKNVIIHRKGATRAREREICIIPGSQGSSSYICTGKGNEESFMSCSHGAGRTMSCSKARKTLDYDVELKKLDDLGTIHTITSEKQLSEAVGAYKDISKVMESQKDLVDIKVELKPLMTIKGDR